MMNTLLEIHQLSTDRAEYLRRQHSFPSNASHVHMVQDILLPTISLREWNSFSPFLLFTLVFDSGIQPDNVLY